MSESEILELAKECGLLPYGDTLPKHPEERFVDYQDLRDELFAFAEAIRRKTLEEALIKLQEAGLGHAAGFYTLERLKAMAQEGVTK
jgi:hypothetical protein